MMIAFTSLPAFVTMVLRGMPNVWRGRHRLLSSLERNQPHCSPPSLPQLPSRAW